MRTTRRRAIQLAAIPLSLALVASACGSDDDSSSSGGDTSGTDVSGTSGGDSGGDMDTAECAVDEVDGDLALFNWAEYIDPDQLQEFADEYGISATMDVYDSNEAMLPQIQAGNSGYDVIVPSDYMVSIMTAGEFIQPLNQDAIPNLANLATEFQGLPYDPDNTYSVPYQAGTTGLAVDTEVVGTDFPRSWSIVFDPEFADQFGGQISLLNDPRETLGAALKYLGYSLNTTSQEELDQARDLVSSASGNLAAFNTDSADELLTSGETAIAHGFSGDMFTQILETDEGTDRYVYFVPEEGGTRWIDNMAIPFDAPHPCTAHTFINWLMDGEQGAALANWNYYTTPNEAAKPFLDEDLLAFLEDPTVITSGEESLELIVDTGDFEINYSDAFIEAKG
ncbi:MAG: spermidine/putrescine ABC transporter substrate-binding protein [Ilumatobacteraceae bacterium]|jgi:spermidine/putrescine-binding protein